MKVLLMMTLLTLGIWWVAQAAQPGDQPWQAFLGGFSIATYVQMANRDRQ